MVVAAISATALVGLAWPEAGRRRPAILLALGFLLFVPQTAVSALMPAEWIELRVVLRGILSLAGATLVLAGIRDLLGASLFPWLLRLFLLSAALLIASLFVFDAEPGLRLGVWAGVYAAIRLSTAWAIWRLGREQIAFAAGVVALLVSLDGAFAVVRGGQLLDAWAWLPFFASASAKSWSWLSLLASTLASAMLVLILVMREIPTMHTRDAAHLRSILVALPDLLFEIGPDGRYLSYHSSRSELLVAEESSIVGARPEEILPPSLVQLQREVMAEVDEKGSSFGREYALDLSLGRRWFELSAARKAAPALGRSHGYIFLARDVTDRKQAHEKLRYRTSLLNHLFESAPLGLLLSRVSDRRFVEANAAFEAICGYPWADLSTMTSDDLFSPEQRRVLNQHRRRLDTVGRFGPVEIELVNKEGQLVPINLTAFKVQESDGQALIWSMVEDLSDRNRLQQVQQAFLSNITHELRTPLTSISGALDLLGSPILQGDDRQRERLLEMARRNVRRLASLIGNLLDLEQLAANQTQLRLRNQPIAPLVTIALKLNQPADNHRIRSAVTPADERLWAIVDGDRLVQVLSNLFSNALKFSPESAPVTVALERRDQAVRITVTDRGPGVPEEFRPLMFDRFALADASSARRTQGSGIGLAVVRELVEKMGGAVGYQPGPDGVGACFYVDFPVSEPGSLP